MGPDPDLDCSTSPGRSSSCILTHLHEFALPWYAMWRRRMCYESVQ
jgi:hypothetical protein